MTHLHRPYVVSRRGFLTDLGRGSVSVAILGFGVAACGDDDEDTDPGGQDSSSGSSTTSTTPDDPTEDTTGDLEDDTGDGAGGGTGSLRFERASFGFVSAYVLVRDGAATIVDTGTGDIAPIEAALAAADSSFDRVGDIIVTHLHGDHAGGVDVLAAAATSARFHAGGADIGGIDTDVELMAIADGAEVAGLQIVATPGHTLGHISVFDPSSGVLVAGDALNLSSGSLEGSAPQFTADEAAAETSVVALAGFDVRTILPGHGEPLLDNAGDALRALAG